jgi:type VI protein secretion system component VasF
MNRLPTWAKALIAIVIFAALYGGAQLLLWIDRGATTGKAGFQ